MKINSIPGSKFLCGLLFSVAYAIAFFQRNSLQNTLGPISSELDLSRSEIGLLASGYFYAYGICQLLAGYWSDRYGARRMLAWSLVLSALGTLGFALSTSFVALTFSRMVTATGDALVFTAFISWISQEVSKERFGAISGLSQVSGYVGGLVATSPLYFLIIQFGWRTCFASLTAILMLMLCIIPLLGREKRSRESHEAAVGNLWRSIRRQMHQRGALGIVLTFSTSFAVAASFSSVWGLQLLISEYGLDGRDANALMFMFMLAYAAGAAGFGLLADRVRAISSVLLFTGIVRVICLVTLNPLVGAYLGGPMISATVLVFGLMSGSFTPLILRAIREWAGKNAVGTGISFNSIFAFGLVVLLQPIIGLLLESRQLDKVGGVIVYSNTGFVYAMALLAAIASGSVVGPLLIGKGANT